MLFVQHIVKSASMKFLCVTWVTCIQHKYKYKPKYKQLPPWSHSACALEGHSYVRTTQRTFPAAQRGRKLRRRPPEVDKIFIFYIFIILIIILYFCYILRRRPPEVDKIYNELESWYQVRHICATYIYKIWLFYLIAYFVEELDVEVSKWRDGHCKLFTQSHLIYDWISISCVWNS